MKIARKYMRLWLHDLYVDICNVVYVIIKTVYKCVDSIEKKFNTRRFFFLKYPVFLVSWTQQKVCMPAVVNVCEYKIFMFAH